MRLTGWDSRWLSCWNVEKVKQHGVCTAAWSAALWTSPDSFHPHGASWQVSSYTVVYFAGVCYQTLCVTAWCCHIKGSSTQFEFIGVCESPSDFPSSFDCSVVSWQPCLQNSATPLWPSILKHFIMSSQWAQRAPETRAARVDPPAETQPAVSRNNVQEDQQPTPTGWDGARRYITPWRKKT